MAPQSVRLIYLHGFASGPSSRKACFLSDRFNERGISLESPDLSEANFENLTITGQLHVIDRLIGSDRACLIGSSLGGYLAGMFAASHPQVEKLVLLAPAFGFLDLWKERLGEAEMQRWEATDQLAVYHYSEQREQNLRFGFMRDAARYPLVPEFGQPTLILHGDRDDTVPVEHSVQFAAGHPNARLVTLESDHELGNVLDRIWEETWEFLQPVGLAKSVLG